MYIVKCRKCDMAIEVTTENTRLVLYSEAPWLNNAHTWCPGCEIVIVCFVFGLVPGLLAFGIKAKRFRYPPEEIHVGFEEVFGVQSPRVHPLSDPERNQVRFFHLLLKKVKTVEEFMKS